MAIPYSTFHTDFNDQIPDPFIIINHQNHEALIKESNQWQTMESKIRNPDHESYTHWLIWNVSLNRTRTVDDFHFH